MSAKPTLKAKLRLSNFPEDVSVNLDSLINSLVSLRDKAIKAPEKLDANNGICYLWHREHMRLNKRKDWLQTGTTIIVIRDLSAEWPESAKPGRPTYCPIGLVWGNPKLDHWGGINLERRLSLIRFTLKRLRSWQRHKRDSERRVITNPPTLSQIFLRSLSQADLALSISTLMELIQDALTNNIRARDVGICFNWQSKVYRVNDQLNPYDLVMYLAAKWPKTQFPGVNSMQPVPANYKFPKWEGPNLELRIDLMHYMLKRLYDLKRHAKE